MQFSLLTAVYVFLMSAALDIFWVFGVRRVSQGRPLQSAFFSSLITVIGATIVISYVDNKLFLVPTVLGGFIGNYIAVTFDSRFPQLKYKLKSRKKH